MDRFTMTKVTDERNYNTFLFKRDNSKEFIITFCGNLDLYFCLYNFNDKPYFIIDKSNYIIYELFDKLYNDIKNCDIFDDAYKEYYKNKYEYKLLLKENIIEWKCDDFPDEIAPYFNIIKEEDCYIIKFKQCIIDYNIDWQYPLIRDNYISVRLRNSGSRYAPFNCVFMRLYNSLSNIDEIDLDQIHIEEYLYNQKKKLLLK